MLGVLSKKKKKVIVALYFNGKEIHRPQSNAATLQPMGEATGRAANQRAAGAFKLQTGSSSEQLSFKLRPKTFFRRFMV